MKTVQQIYDEYKISPTLQMHQLRVAGVAKIIIENFDEVVDKEAVVLACVFHDMGNIIKFDLNYFPEFNKPEGVEYWEKIKMEFIEKYGKDEHIATLLIAKEIGLSKEVISYLKNIGFSNSPKNFESSSFENKICNYSDMRVDPYGVIPMEERILEAKKRYADKTHSINSPSFVLCVESLKKIEKQIFEKTNIKPEDITNEKIEGIILELRNKIIPSIPSKNRSY